MSTISFTDECFPREHEENEVEETTEREQVTLGGNVKVLGGKIDNEIIGDMAVANGSGGNEYNDHKDGSRERLCSLDGSDAGTEKHCQEIEEGKRYHRT